MKRREFMTGSLAVAAFTSLPTTPDELLHHAPVDPMDRLRDALVEAGPACGEPAPIDHLRRATAAAKRLVQACHYTPLARTLPALLTELTVQRASAGERCQSDLLSVDAYHVAASLLLKADDPASAWVAAEKAMMAARRSGNATAFATAARILTHAVAAVGHHRQAVRVAVQAVGQLQGGVKRSDPDRIAVFGSLLLRAAWAAAKADDRDTAELLLADAGRAAQLMDKSPNRRWTAFEPNNVDLHRVSIALTFGDAGRALDEARRVNVGTLAVAERRAVFWTDAARALFSCGRLEKAAVALLTAEREAPEEVRSRPVVRHLIGELLMRDQGGKVPLLRSLASRAQVAV
ncbi:hypothetical protein ACIHFE_09505 [Streptomyces sp. NPDC052396]|uniref:hypothetical protein n=1 Tax=Streptomyces sp. NPDC052396 TaxID=3365689 RepID=UPI0037D60C2B